MNGEIKRVIVTGGTGVTGNALVRYLLKQDIEVFALVRPDSFRKKYLPEDDRLNVLDCGMDDYKSIDKRLDAGAYDAFFHLSWDGSTGKNKVTNRNAYHMQNKNVSYALDAVELCRRLGCKTFIMTGTQAEYGRYDRPVREDDDKNPENAYGMAKLCAEGMTRLMCKEYGIRHIWPILFSVYGPNHATMSLIDTTVRGLLKGKKLSFTEGVQKWDYLYSYDAAKALYLLAVYGKDGEAYNVAFGKSIPLKEYILKIYEELAPGYAPVFGEIEYAENPLMYLGADTTKLCKTTGFVPEFSFERGIGEIADAIKSERFAG